MPRKSQKAKDQEIIDEALERFDAWQEAEAENRLHALEDIRFVDEDDGQWTKEAKAKREGRPCMTFDRVSSAVNQIVGDMLQNRPSPKVRAAEDGDIDTADVYTGLIRAIENSSEGKRAHGTAFKFAVKGGYGVWRIRHDYCHDETFDQDIIIEPIYNPFSVLFDPYAKKITREDGRAAFVFEDMDKKDFEREYPNASTQDTFELVYGKDWCTKDSIRICEYYRKVPKMSKIYRLSSGEVVRAEEFDDIIEEAAQQGIFIEAEREVETHDIEYYKLTANDILDRIEYKGRYIPLIPVYGKHTNVDGKFLYRGVVRKAKDAQRAFNYEVSNIIEHGSLQPKAPYMATPAMLLGHEKQWSKINTSNDPVLVFNPDPEMPGGKPFREPPPQSNAAAMNIAMMMADNIKSTTDIFDASLGARSNETSGKAIQARDRQGDTATFEFADELMEAVRYEGRILLDLIPKIYDTRRQLRIMGEDDQEEVMEVNKPILDYETGEPVIVNDLTRGRYDLHMDSGPSYSTKRVETAEQLSQIVAQNPQMSTVLGDVWVKALDLTDGDEVRKRLRKLGIKEGFIDPDPNDEEEQAMIQQREQRMQLEQMAAGLEKETKQIENEKTRAEIQKTLADAEESKADAQKTMLEVQMQARGLKPGAIVYDPETGAVSAL